MRGWTWITLGRIVPVLLLLAMPAAAQTGGASLPGASEESRGVARDLVEQLGITAQMRGILPTLSQQMVRALTQTNPAQAEAAARVVDEILMPEFVQRLPELTGMIAEVYAARFSVEDLHGLQAFYRGDLGRKLLANQVAISQQMFELGSAWGQEVAKDALGKNLEELRRRGFKL